MKCVWNFIRVFPTDVTTSPTARGYNDFSWRMLHRQYYLLHETHFPFEVRTRFLIDQTDTEYTAENAIWNDLIFHAGQDYASKLYEIIQKENCDGFVITRYMSGKVQN